ncbi:related to CHO1 - CDP-diacylglycerol serine O-phosphatidyltransferase [Melanopsichium pennsylvanicum]|uniref:CDP-diacylglycerol--serine O-phosphatidyltransferase n=2 Tax=Melanopsichium pennsylvanicum TaxID=63383 RepID=A0AAJ5C7L6_9BASI|nr:related to CHO1-CDP-diacylglycerol serine O-phosphatidyltransferase [Melanopsichium pennsylvanicum 4]SNX87047.1 related to CHO1 - CDP-diacylglycerol serine O-phosphatidyltransferase [Melanopsichium pennsylvanicum]
MPGTIPAITDPTLVDQSSTTKTNRATLAAVSDHPSTSKIPLAPSLSTPVFASHPTSGVASKGATQLTTTASRTSALAPTNLQANMTKQLSSSSSAAGKNLRNRKSNSSSRSAAHDTSSELLKFIETDGHFSLVRNFHLADAFTLMNAFCGAQSLFASARYLITSDPKHAWLALWFPLFGAIFDLLDGKVARWRKSSSMLGQELDSLADSLSFGAAPAFAAYSLGLRGELDALILTMFVCAGVARLARFNVTAATIPHDASGKARYFEGLPIPSSLVLVGGMAICLLTGRIEPGGLPIALAKERGYISSKGLTFTASLREYLPDSFSGRGVPLGTFTIDFRHYLVQLFKLVPGFGVKAANEWAECLGKIQGHWLAFIWLAWATAMISKTLRVPKP